MQCNYITNQALTYQRLMLTTQAQASPPLKQLNITSQGDLKCFFKIHCSRFEV
jgi:hypothetical protein